MAVIEIKSFERVLGENGYTYPMNIDYDKLYHLCCRLFSPNTRTFGGLVDESVFKKLHGILLTNLEIMFKAKLREMGLGKVEVMRCSLVEKTSFEVKLMPRPYADEKVFYAGFLVREGEESHYVYYYLRRSRKQIVVVPDRKAEMIKEELLEAF